MLNADGHAPDPVPIFAALGDRTRLSLLGRLGDGTARSITALSADTHLTRQAVTKHLRVLERAGLVRALKQGREIRFAIELGRIDAARSYLDQVARQWDDALARLKAFVES
jgi:DNA-binding transcriptional ArsR family regulator